MNGDVSLFYKANIAAPFDPRLFNFGGVLQLRAQPEVLLQIVPRNMISTHRGLHQVPLFNDQIGLAFNQLAKPM